VPLYAVAQRYIAAEKDPALFSPEELFEEIERQAEQGVDFMTVHCGITARGAAWASEKGGRVLGVVSRGGSILARWMRTHKRENPLLEEYDRILAIARKHNVTLSLGDGLRPGAGRDAGDAAQWEEVVMLGRLAGQGLAEGVQCMVEGPGHVPMHQVEAQIRGIKAATKGAPLYVLGPLVIDSCPGYDHIAGAIGGAMAVRAGVDFLCYLTPAEHLTLPGKEDVVAGVIASHRRSGRGSGPRQKKRPGQGTGHVRRAHGPGLERHARSRHRPRHVLRPPRPARGRRSLRHVRRILRRKNAPHGVRKMPPAAAGNPPCAAPGWKVWIALARCASQTRRRGDGVALRTFTKTETAILRIVQRDLPDSLTPFADIAREAGCGEGFVLAFLESLKAEGAIRRFGASVKHQKAGYAHNAMVAWIVDEAHVDAAGEAAAAHGSVSHCYYRPSPAADWPYTFYTMLHGRTAGECAAAIDELARSADLGEHAVLTSIRELKKISMTYFQEA
jgi:DNA-binding Lrp family transcriptional regulator